jgi:hypothetical protein
MSSVGSRGFLLFAATLFLTCSSRAVLASPGAHATKSWLNQAVSEKQCPATPVNVPDSNKESVNSLRNRIFISGDKLYIKGTDDPDHIVVSSGGSSRSVNIVWNGKRLGRFGPVKNIELRGHAGDDVLIVRSSVTLPVLIDGGSDDDCLQGGSGADQLFAGSGLGNDVLIAGTGRPALIVSSGNDRVVVPHRMGTLRYAPGADSGVLRLLGTIYHLEPLGESTANDKAASSPIVLGVADLGDEQILSQLRAARAAGESVVLTNAAAADSEKLRIALGHPNAAIRLAAGKPATTTDQTVALTFFRSALRPGTKAYDYRAGYFASLPKSLDDWTIQLLSRIFSKTAVVPKAPGDSPSNDLQNLASSYTSDDVEGNAAGDSLHIENSAWAVRSFQNNSDFYYIVQVVENRVGSPAAKLTGTEDNFISSFTATPGVVQTSPASTYCTRSTTSGTTWNIGGSAGWNYEQTANATLSGGVSVSNSTTVTCPAVTILNQGNPSSGHVRWRYTSPFTVNEGPSLNTFTNQWIWQVDFDAYQSDVPPGQTSIVFQTVAEQTDLSGELAVDLGSAVPIPFGNTFKLQDPVITKVSPTCVNAGDTFNIFGSGMYPSLVSSVSIGGTRLHSSQYTVNSDTNIQAVAPPQSGYYLPVVVKTGVGTSNTNVEIEISTYHLCP